MNMNEHIAIGGARPKVKNYKAISGGIKSGDSTSTGICNGNLIGDPLDTKKIYLKSDGAQIHKPALHKDWMEPRSYVNFRSPPVLNDSGEIMPGELEAWLENVQFIKSDLDYFLRMPHHKFWSQMVYDKSLHKCLESYLSQCPRWYEDIEYDETISNHLQALHQSVFHLFLRMATYKESKEDHITPQAWGNLIYDHFLFDMCKILDLCVLYSTTNLELLSKVVKNIFTYQPCYYDDLKHIIDSLFSVFENIEISLGVADQATPLTLGSCSSRPTQTELHDTIHYLFDTLYSVESLLKVFPKAAQQFHNKDYELRLASCYEKVIPAITKEIMNIQRYSENDVFAAKLIEKLKEVRLISLSTFNLIIKNVALPNSVVKDSEDPGGICKFTERYIRIMSNIVAEKSFIFDYNTIYPIQNDIIQLRDNGADTTNIRFIEEAVHTVIAEVESQEISSNNLTNVENSSGLENGFGSNINGDSSLCSNQSPVSDVQLASLVSCVQDLFPDLSVEYIKKCLEYYNNSSEDLINALLESNLPPSLQSLEIKDVPEDKSQTETSVRPKDGILSNRANVHDQDEFDLFNNSGKIDMSRIHKGKSNKISKNRNDEEFSAKMKEIASKYDERKGTSIYEDELAYTPQAATIDYDDEYDDTYDDHLMSADLAAEAERNFPTIRGKGALNKRIPDSSSDEQESDNEDNSKNRNNSLPNGVKGDRSSSSRSREGSSKRDYYPNKYRDQIDNSNNEHTNKYTKSFQPFCENPEIVRQRAEQRRMDRDRLRNRGRGSMYRNHGGGGGGATSDGRTTTNDGQDNPHGTNNEYGGSHKSYAPGKSSGKSWRNFSNEDSDRRQHGGKLKQESSTHGKAQSRTHRHNMVHKNEHKRAGAQAKFNRNN